MLIYVVANLLLVHTSLNCRAVLSKTQILFLNKFSTLVQEMLLVHHRDEDKLDDEEGEWLVDDRDSREEDAADANNRGQG